MLLVNLIGLCDGNSVNCCHVLSPFGDCFNEEKCENVDCETGAHWYPKVGSRVRLKKDARLREPGTDNLEWHIKSYESGVVEDICHEFHEAVVVFPRGRKVWADISTLWTEGS